MCVFLVENRERHIHMMFVCVVVICVLSLFSFPVRICLPQIPSPHGDSNSSTTHCVASAAKGFC